MTIVCLREEMKNRSGQVMRVRNPDHGETAENRQPIRGTAFVRTRRLERKKRVGEERVSGKYAKRDGGPHGTPSTATCMPVNAPQITVSLKSSHWPAGTGGKPRY